MKVSQAIESYKDYHKINSKKKRNYNQKKGYYGPAGQLIGQKIPPFFDRRNCRPQARLNKD